MGEIIVKKRAAKAQTLVFSPLDWGLGHTTRSIPLLQAFQTLDFSLVIACNSTQTEILRPAFPNARFETLEGYDLHFGKSRWSTLGQISLQAPKILTKIKSENQWIKQFCLDEKPDLVLSDSRFGFQSSLCPSLFLTHQLSITTGLGPLADRLIRVFNKKYLSRFTQCWVADHEQDEYALAGLLSRNNLLPQVNYLGPLSRFPSGNVSTSIPNRILILLSGPEPQRTLLEKIILEQAAVLKAEWIVVRGKPGETGLPPVPSHITCFNHLPDDLLQNELGKAEFVISRSGYSSLMDYARTGKRALLIPTPGQAEQEYLARYWQSRKWAIGFEQDSFQLSTAIAAARSFPYKTPMTSSTDLASRVAESLSSLGIVPAN